MKMNIPSPSPFIAALLVLSTFFSLGGQVRAGWHPDPDDDGINSNYDLCPYVYDPLQGDADGDGIGNYCDPDFSPPTLNDRISDLRIEHISPYGAWLSFTSPYDNYFYGWHAVAAWSTIPGELSTAAGFSAAQARGDLIELGRIHADYGEKNEEPIILTDLEPNTTYYVAVTRGSIADGYDPGVSNIVSFTTKNIALPTPPAAHPRVYATPAFILELKARRASNDSGWNKWENAIRSKAVSDGDRRYCFDAALLYQVTGNAQDLTTALSIFNNSITFWENTVLVNNAFRWENAQLGACLDLLWNDIDQSLRNRAIRAFLEDDEYNITDRTLRRDDTDEFASFPRNWIVDGLVACGATDIDAALSARACAVLEHGHRLWHGVQLVKARRERGKYAQSDGFKPDGTAYGQGTQLYWLEIFLALANSGESLEPYGPHIEHSLMSTFLHLFTPTQKGFASNGDVEAYTDNFGIEPNSYQLRRANGGVLGLFSGVLARAGHSQAAGWAKHLLSKRYDVDPLNKVDGTTVYRLMFETDSITAVDHAQSLGTFFHAEGFGTVFDRTSWADTASYLMFRAGWNTVDHVHADVGHFQLFRKGRWLTHESIAYGGLASCLGHNIWVMKTGDTGGGACPGGFGQNFFAQSDNTRSLILRASSGYDYTYVSAEMAGAYNIFKERDIRNFDSVQRSLLWIKDNSGFGVDTLVILDRIETSSNAEADAIGYYQLHLDTSPAISNKRATTTLGDQQLVVDVVSPSTATLSTISPSGAPGASSDQAIYTHRLRIDPGASGQPLNMITVLRGSGAGQTLDQPIAVNGSGLQGTYTQGALVLMPTSPIKDRGASLSSGSVSLSTTNALTVFITGLKKETGYSLQATQAGASLTISISPNGNLKTDEGGVLGVRIDSGRNIVPIEISYTIFNDDFEAFGT
jgi:hypothetical protein